MGPYKLVLLLTFYPSHQYNVFSVQAQNKGQAKGDGSYPKYKTYNFFSPILKSRVLAGLYPPEQEKQKNQEKQKEQEKQQEQVKQQEQMKGVFMKCEVWSVEERR